MKSYHTLSLEHFDRILVITLNRPNALNALNIELLSELNEVFTVSASNDGIGGIILTGSGDKAFAAGADIKEISELNTSNPSGFSTSGQSVFAAIENFNKPVIAAVNGYALGGGCELAMCCHFRIASSAAQFGQPEVNLGLIPGYGGTQRLTKLIGKGRAMELMMTGNIIDAQEALRLGLVNHVTHDQEEMMSLAFKLLGKILTKAPIAIAKVIACTNAAESSDVDGYLLEANSFSECCDTKDFIEGTAAFIEKRKPRFVGK